MKIVSTYSADADTAYVAFGDSREVAETIAPMDDVAIDLDADGRIVGIEFVTASRTLDPSVLEDADSDELIGVSEIAKLIRKRKQNVTQHYTRRDDFPRPAVELPTGRYWRRGDVEAWSAWFKRAEPGWKKAEEVASAAEWLTHCLRFGGQRVSEIREGAARSGLAWPVVKRAADTIEVERWGRGRSTHWDLPAEHPWAEEQADDRAQSTS